MSPSLLTLLIDKARRLEDGAYPLLMEVGDPSAAPALRALLTDPLARMRRAGVSALGWSGDEDDVTLVEPLLRDSDRQVRAEAIATVAELGGPMAADLLRGVADLPGAEGGLALRGLAWLGDRRAGETLLASMDTWLADFTGYWMAEGVLRASREDGWQALARAVRARFESVSHDADLVVPLKVALTVVDEAVRRVLPERLGLLREQLADVIDFLVAEIPSTALRFPGVHPPERPLAIPGGARVVPSRPLRYGVAPTGDDSEVPAKFRGQPDWREAPLWPVGPHGPLPFYGQLPLPGSSTAYIFVGEESWEALGPGNAVVIQPGAPPHLPTLPMAVGPQIHEFGSCD